MYSCATRTLRSRDAALRAFQTLTLIFSVCSFGRTIMAEPYENANLRKQYFQSWAFYQIQMRPTQSHRMR